MVKLKQVEWIEHKRTRRDIHLFFRCESTGIEPRPSRVGTLSDEARLGAGHP